MRVLWGGLLVCLGCSQPAKPVCTVLQSPFERYLEEGEAAQVQIGILENCFTVGSFFDPPADFHKSDQVIVEVLDPEGKSAAFTASAPVRTLEPSLIRNSAMVSFNASMPGRWRVTARFEPSIGQATLVIPVAQWKGDAGVRVVPINMPACDFYGTLETNTVVCVNAQGLTTGVGQHVSGTQFGLGSTTVWAASPGTIERFVDDGGTLVSTHREGLTGVLLANGAGNMAATNDDVWTTTFDPPTGETTLFHVRAEADGGTTMEKTLLVPIPPIALSIIDGGLLRVPASTVGLAILMPDGGERLTGSLVPGAQAFDGNLGWRWNSGSSIDAFRFEGAKVVRATLALPPEIPVPGETAWSLAPSAIVVPRAGPDAGPIGSVRTYVPAFDGAQVELENYDAGAGYGPLFGATRKHVFVRSLDGNALKIFDR